MSNRGIPLALVWVPQEGISHRLPSDLLRGVWPERQLAVCALKRAVWESCRMRQWCACAPGASLQGSDHDRCFHAPF